MPNKSRSKEGAGILIFILTAALGGYYMCDDIFRPMAATLTLTSPANNSIVWDRTPVLDFTLTEAAEVILYVDNQAPQNLTTITSYSANMSLMGEGNHSMSLYFDGSHHNTSFRINSYEVIYPGQLTCFSAALGSSHSSDSSNYLKLPCSSEVISNNFSISPTGTQFIYQEDPDWTTCTGDWNISGPCSKTYDGNWMTVGFCQTDHACAMQCSYDKPTGAISAKWRIGWSAQEFTVPQLCWDQSPIWFILESYATPAPGPGSSVNWSCHNGTAFTLILTEPHGRNMKEEGILWGYDYLTNVTVHISDQLVFNDSHMDSSDTSYFSANQAIQDSLSIGNSSNCSIYVNVSSDFGNAKICSINTTFLRWHDPAASLSEGIPYFYFFPKHRSEKNVSAWKQNETTGALNFSTNWPSNCQLYAKLNTTLTNVTIKATNLSDTNYTVNLTTDYTLMKSNVSDGEMLWFWADYFNPPSLPKAYSIWFLCYGTD